MYGPLASRVLSVGQMAGPNNWAGRCLSLASSVLLIALLVVSSLRGGGHRFVVWIFAVACYAVIAEPTGWHFTSPRPDMHAMFLGTTGLICLWRAHERLSVWLGVAGIVAILLAFSQKQTAAAVGLIAVVPCLLDTRLSWTRRIACGCLPASVVVAAVVALRIFLPDTYHFVVRVPGQYSIPKLRVVSSFIDMIPMYPLFWAVLFYCVGSRSGLGHDSKADPRGDRAARVRRWSWIVSGSVVLCGISVLGRAKLGGSGNSYLPALFLTCRHDRSPCGQGYSP